MKVLESPVAQAEPTPASAPKPPSDSRLAYMPALDGLRGLLLFAILLYHNRFPWAKGGLFAVSSFFTLSGYLITSLIISERNKSGGLNLRTFYTRRVRRLMPASYAGLALAVVFGIFVADSLQRQNLGGDITAAVLYVANWRFIFNEQSYEALFSAPSPIQHFWSLAIEEQFYMLYPLAIFALFRSKLSRAKVATILALVTFALAIEPIVFQMSHDRVYYGTDTRAPELLIGVLLALAVQQKRAHDLVFGRGWRVTAWVGVAAIGVFWVLFFTVKHDTDWIFRGGLPLYAFVSAAMVAAAVLSRGPVRRALAWKPLVRLGVISYGVYVFHWPLFLWIDERRTGLEGWPLLIVRMIVVLAVAELSFRFLEKPIRHSAHVRWFGKLKPSYFAVPVGLALILGAVAVSATAPPPAIDYAAAEAQTASGVTYVPPPPVDPTAATPPTARIAMFGDSTSLLTSYGVAQWANGSEDADYVGGVTWTGCGVARGGVRRTSPGNEQENPKPCENWETVWGEAVRSLAPNVAVVQVGPWESLDRQLPGDPTWRSPGDPAYDEYLTDEFLAAVDTLSSQGAEVIWLTNPPVNDNVDPTAAFGSPEARDPRRIDRVNEIIESLPAQRPGKVHVVDLATWLAGTGKDLEWRPDGVHFGNEGSAEAAKQFLGPEIVKTFDQAWVDGRDERIKQYEEIRRSIVPAKAPGPGETPRVLVWGDATAVPVGQALQAWGDANGAQVTSIANDTCGIARSDVRRLDGNQTPVPPECREWTTLEQAIQQVKPHAVVILTGAFEVADQRIMGDVRAWENPGKAVYQAWYRSELGAAADAAHENGAAVFVLTQPHFVGDGPAFEPQRVDGLNLAAVEVVNGPTRSPWMRLLDLAGEAQTWPGGEADSTYRPDGVTLSPQGAQAVAAQLGPEVVQQLNQLRQQR